MILITGGAGFIGSNFVHTWLSQFDEPVINLDKLTYAGNRANFATLQNDARHNFVQGDIADRSLIERLLSEYRPRAVINFAAESHVDRSIHGPGDFIQTNVVGTFNLLEASRIYWEKLPEEQKLAFRFLHVSTDEVYGTLSAEDPPFSETNAYQPNSPYSASKAASDHLVRAWHHTYGLPVLTTNCSNNYGPYHFPEKLIPLVILNALAGKALPIYGDGQQIRDWLYVEDHCRAIMRVLQDGRIGETYNIGGWNEKANIDVIRAVCTILDELRPKVSGKSYTEQMTFVQDRPGHDRRYAIDARKIERELGWKPQETFESGIRKTINWYLDHPQWVEGVTSGAYKQWIDVQYKHQPNIKRILILGANGQVGTELSRELTDLGEVIALRRDEADLSQPEHLRMVIRKYSPQIIVNAAAYTAVDKAESEPELAHLINAVAPGVLAEEAESLNACLVHYSTDYVFDGYKTEPYVETDVTNPLSEYGRSKLAGERAVAAVCRKHLIFRTSWVFNTTGNNFLKTMLRLGSERDSLRVVADQVGAPTSAALIAEVTRRALQTLSQLPAEDSRWGMYHLVADGETSWHGYAAHVVAQAHTLGIALRVSQDAITPISTVDYPLPAIRPANSRLSTNRLRTCLDVELPHWTDGVNAVIRQLVSQESE